MSNLTLRFYSLSLTIKTEICFGKLLVIPESRLSKYNKHLESYKFALNQEYQSLVRLIFSGSVRPSTLQY